MPPTSTIVQIGAALTEQSNYRVTATVVGPDGLTGVEPAAAATLTATLVNLEPGGGVIFADRDVKTYLAAGGAFDMPLLYSDLDAASTARMERRMLILKLVQTNGVRKVQPIEFFVQNIPGL